MRLGSLLVGRGDAVIGLIRNPDHAAEVRATGVDPVICDLEQATVEQIAAAVSGSDAVVFAAGAGPGSGADRKLTMDRDGAIKLLHATAADSSRYVMVSAVGAEHPPDGEDVFSVYLRAKAGADAALAATDRGWTIVRPGRLTDDPGTGSVRIDSAPFRGEIPRDDVAALLAAVLAELPRGAAHPVRQRRARADRSRARECVEGDRLDRHRPNARDQLAIHHRVYGKTRRLGDEFDLRRAEIEPGLEICARNRQDCTAHEVSRDRLVHMAAGYPSDLRVTSQDPAERPPIGAG